MKEITLMSLTEAIPNENIFYNMVSSNLSFIPDASVASYLDSEYFANRSGSKQCSPLVEKLSGQPDYEQTLAAIIVNRYKPKWESLFSRYTTLSTLDILGNINITRETTYGKNVSHSSSDTRTKSGTETTTLNGEEITEESFPTSRKSKRTISGGWQDSGSTSNTRRGTEETTETYPVAWQVSKTIEGGYSDSDTTAITHTGTETTTESFPTSRQSSKVTSGGYSDTTSSSNVRSGSETDATSGTTTESVYGFNSSSAVPSSITSPATSTSKTYNNLSDTGSGSASRTYSNMSETVTESGSKQLEHSLGQGMADTHSGAITRVYSGYTESETTTGTKRTEKSLGLSGLTDSGTDSSSRQYNNYVDEVEESGSRRTSKTFGSNGRTSQLSFNGRSDTDTFSESWGNTGKDTHTEVGYKYDSLVKEYLNLFTSAQYIDFLEIVYSDCDEVLTCPFYV